ncbi:hypothetical protein [Aquisediminimonas sediminicola]|uniref:hypothetical protein n=1 Tax=Alteraquisediminimonas sediminicola TaxID=2676787 RepID=UPI001FE5B317|nr:hypothetical protein [Aquisediminimonas sediminicola]
MHDMMKSGMAAMTLLALAACSGDKPVAEANNEAQAPAAASSYFVNEIVPIFRQKCATCHLTGSEAGQMALTPDKAWESLVNVASIEATDKKRVVPGNPDASYLVMKLEGKHLENGGSGARMPFAAPPLPLEEVAKIREWIAKGAEK